MIFAILVNQLTVSYTHLDVYKRQHKHHLPTHYYIPDTAGLKYRSIVMMEQIKVIDKTRLIKDIGSVTPRFMKILDKRILISLGIPKKRS